MIRTPRFALAIFVPLLLLPCSVINAEIVDISGYVHGQQIMNNDFLSPLVQVSASGSNLGLAIFDTHQSSANDPDLEVNRGNALIVQSNNSPSLNGGVYQTPNDDRHGGLFTFTFQRAITVQSIDLIDIDANSAVTVILTSGSNTRTYNVPDNWTGQVGSTQGWDTLDLTTTFSQSGSGTGGLATFSEDAGFDSTGVTMMTVDLTGSGAINNLTVVPEPGSFTLFAAACLSLVYRRRTS